MGDGEMGDWRDGVPELSGYQGMRYLGYWVLGIWANLRVPGNRVLGTGYWVIRIPGLSSGYSLAPSIPTT
jgi:hypothetical protein